MDAWAKQCVFRPVLTELTGVHHLRDGAVQSFDGHGQPNRQRRGPYTMGAHCHPSGLVGAWGLPGALVLTSRPV